MQLPSCTLLAGPACCFTEAPPPPALRRRSYPHALYFLDLLQTPEFRAKIANPAYKELVHTQQVGAALAEPGAVSAPAALPPPPALRRPLHARAPLHAPSPTPPTPQFFFWQHARANRLRQKAEAGAAAQPGGGAAAMDVDAAAGTQQLPRPG